MNDLIGRGWRIDAGQAGLAQQRQQFERDGLKGVLRRMDFGSALQARIDAVPEVSAGFIPVLSRLLQ